LELYDKTIGLNKKTINAQNDELVKKRKVRKTTKIINETTNKLYLEEINDF
jgi:hypothetical protein